MIPYFTLPVVRILGQPLHPFMWLMSLGMVLCYFLAQRRVKAVGLYAPLSAVALAWVAVGGFIGAHVVEIVAYYPERLLTDPLSLLRVWEGISSFGGFIGGTIALLIYCKRYGIWMLAYLDALWYGFAPGWIVARSGCFFSHDHLGLPSDFLLAVAYPGGARHNLGLYEMLWAAVISIVLYALARRPTPFVGFHTAVVLLLYAPARFLLDLLRTGDRRYAALTPAQWLCFVLLGIAIYLIIRGRSRSGPTEVTAGASPVARAGRGKDST